MADLPYPTADFFGFEELLSPAEQAKLQQVRAWLTAEVKPIAVDHWNRQEFPQHLTPRSRSSTSSAPFVVLAIPTSSRAS